MPIYIDADKLLIETQQSCWDINVNELLQILSYVPTADVQEVRHGKWQMASDESYYANCSACRKCFMPTDWLGDGRRWQYCPRCGARMDEKDGEQ